MIGASILGAALLGLLGGFTGLTYPLVLVGLGLCACDVISPAFAIAFTPLSIIHHLRMQNPSYAPPFLSRSGFIPIIGAACMILTLITASKIIGVGLTVTKILTASVFVILAALIILVRREDSRQKKMIALFHTNLAVRYQKFLEKIGSLLNEQTCNDAKIAHLTKIMGERDEIYTELSAAGVKPDHFAHFLIEKAQYGEFPCVEEKADNIIIQTPEGTPLAENLFVTSMAGIEILKKTISPMMLETGSPLPRNRTEAGYIIHSFALVWTAITLNVPVEDGKPLMGRQIDLLTAELSKLGFDWTRDQTEASVGRIWMSFIQAPGESGEKLFQIGKIILRYFLEEDEIELTRTLGVVTALASIMENAKTEIEEVIQT